MVPTLRILSSRPVYNTWQDTSKTVLPSPRYCYSNAKLTKTSCHDIYCSLHLKWLWASGGLNISLPPGPLLLGGQEGAKFLAHYPLEAILWFRLLPTCPYTLSFTQTSLDWASLPGLLVDANRRLSDSSLGFDATLLSNSVASKPNAVPTKFSLNCGGNLTA